MYLVAIILVVLFTASCSDSEQPASVEYKLPFDENGIVSLRFGDTLVYEFEEHQLEIVVDSQKNVHVDTIRKTNYSRTYIIVAHYGYLFNPLLFDLYQETMDRYPKITMTENQLTVGREDLFNNGSGLDWTYRFGWAWVDTYCTNSIVALDTIIEVNDRDIKVDRFNRRLMTSIDSWYNFTTDVERGNFIVQVSSSYGVDKNFHLDPKRRMFVVRNARLVRRARSTRF